jgi:hypothetical protein
LQWHDPRKSGRRNPRQHFQLLSLGLTTDYTDGLRDDGKPGNLVTDKSLKGWLDRMGNNLKDGCAAAVLAAG